MSAFCLCMFTACDSDDNNLLCYGTHTDIEGDVTAFGAVGDGKTDCSKAINSAIASLPAEGGVLVIPEGDFVLDAPIVINKHNVKCVRLPLWNFLKLRGIIVNVRRKGTITPFAIPELKSKETHALNILKSHFKIASGIYRHDFLFPRTVPVYH